MEEKNIIERKVELLFQEYENIYNFLKKRSSAFDSQDDNYDQELDIIEDLKDKMSEIYLNLTKLHFNIGVNEDHSLYYYFMPPENRMVRGKNINARLLFHDGADINVEIVDNDENWW